MQFSSVQFSSVQFSSVQCNAMQCNAIQFNSIICMYVCAPILYFALAQLLCQSIKTFRNILSVIEE